MGVRSGLGRARVGAIERGEINLTFAVLRQLADGLHMALSDLIAAGETLEGAES